MTVSKSAAIAIRDMAGEKPLAVRIKGNCMAPLLPSGALVQIARRPYHWPGDLLVILGNDGQLIAHRLIGFYPRAGGMRWLTQADAAERPDGAVTGDRIIGRVRSVGYAATPLRVPFRHRVRAFLQFARFVSFRLTRRAR
jgi:phage repressor protein C with HTH and peptisase S24 domain